MSKCISSHGEYSEHEPGDPCPWCGEYDMARIIAERDAAEARIKAVRRELDRLETLALTSRSENIGILGFSWVTAIRRALDGDQ